MVIFADLVVYLFVIAYMNLERSAVLSNELIMNQQFEKWTLHIEQFVLQ